MGTSRTALRLLPLAVAAFVLLGDEHDARALGPIDIEAGGKVGAGTNPDSNGPNPYGFGLGVRGGIGIANFYGGVSFVHYFGASLAFATPIGTVDYYSNLFGAELGYTIKAIPLIDIRPQLGVGDATFSATSGGATVSTGKLYFEPGVTVLIPLGLIFLGADGNALVVPDVEAPGGGSKTYTSFTIHGQIGIRL